MSDFVNAHLVEVLSVARARTDLDCHGGRPVVIVTIRNQPDRSWTFRNLGLTIAQAERLRDDLTNLLKTPATFLLLAVLALATGCSAKVEVVNERSAVAEADSVPTTPPAAISEKQSVVVDVDFLGQQQPEPAVLNVANQQPVATTNPIPSNQGGIQLNGSKNRIEFHFHRHRRSRSPALICPVVRHEMVIVPGDGTAPVVFLDNAPPRITLVDEQVARAYAAHLVRLAREEGHR